MGRPASLVVFSDLDGTLLDQQNYSYEAAADGLDLLHRLALPLVLCSSKTRAEIALLQEKIGIRHPFISENGGAVFLPKGYFPFSPSGARSVAGYDAIELGRCYMAVVHRLREAASRLGVPIAGFHDMSADQVAALCGLSLAEARLAKQRDYDEPFRILSRVTTGRRRLRLALEREGFRYTQGTRFDHVTGGTDKGRAVARLRTFYTLAAAGPVLTIGLGDSMNDLPLLQTVDVPIVIRNQTNGITARLLGRIRAARVTRRPGPSGWGEAVCEVIAPFAEGLPRAFA